PAASNASRISGERSYATGITSSSRSSWSASRSARDIVSISALKYVESAAGIPVTSASDLRPASFHDLHAPGLDLGGVEPRALPVAAHLRLDLPALVDGRARHLVVGLDHAPHAALVVRDGVGRELPAEREQPVVRHHVVHEAPRERGGRVDVVAGDAHLLV